MNNSHHSTSLHASSSTSSVLRPRNPRLISFNDENDLESVSNKPTLGRPLLPPESSIPGINPIPSSRPSHKGTIALGNTSVNGVSFHGNGKSTVIGGRSASPSSLWDSWSSIQGLASTILGSDVHPQSSKSSRLGKAPAWSLTGRPPYSAPAWGPKAPSTSELASGTPEERQATVQAKKREALLLANEHVQTDSTGRLKRRDSNGDLATRSLVVDHGGDALAYAHNVRPQDTVAGVMIKYGCDQAVFRKVNRLWPNDKIQIRTHVFLPIDACQVKGEQVNLVDESVDLLSGRDPSSFRQDQRDDAQPSPFSTQPSPRPQPLSLSLTPSHDTSSFQHQSWVRIPTIAEPVEILRIPRKTLGFFPPARRKSLTLSDMGLASSPYSDDTPKSSLDMLRHPPTHVASMNASPVRRPLQGRPHRSSSTTGTTKTVTFADRLKGPGGVGPLRGTGMTSSIPGPAEDSLNKLFAHHLPSVAPPGLSPRMMPRASPRASTDSVRSSSTSGLGEVGGAIEGWVRKLGGRNSVRTDHGRERMGDLIELEGTETAGDVLLDDENGDHTPTLNLNANDEALLRERYPPRGRKRDPYPGKGKDD